MTLLIIESLAVILGILYLILAAKEDIKCWYAALISSLLFIYTMYQADLIMQSLLQVFYVIMAVYGWLQWSDKANKKFVLRIKRWRKINHLYAFILIVSLSTILFPWESLSFLNFIEIHVITHKSLRGFF